MNGRHSRLLSIGLLISVLLASLLLATVSGCAGRPRAAAPPGDNPGRQQAALATLTGPLKVHFIDVGQGDSILVQIPNKQTMLIDAGDSSKGPAVTRYLKAQGIESIDYLVVTHPHLDHIGGMADVLAAFPVSGIYMPRTSHTTTAYEDLLRAIKKKGLFVTEARAGGRVLEAANLDVSFIAPVGKGYEDLNEWSAVLRVVYGDTALLFTGDAGAKSEAEMISSKAPLRADVLKIGHHGSAGSTSASFLSAVSPEFAVISVGAGNPYGHPAKKTLARLADAKARVYRTDLHGTIVVISDGSQIAVQTAKEP